MEDALTDKQRRYVENIAKGMPSREAALAAGYSPSFSRVAAHRLGKKSEVSKAIESIQAEGRKVAVYDLATAMKEANEVCNFAKRHKNAMAFCKATELRAKLSGLLIDRVEIATVDLTSALAKAEARVANPPPPTIPAHQSTYYDAPQGIDWRPRIPGTPVANPAADGESDRKVKNGGSENR